MAIRVRARWANDPHEVGAKEEGRVLKRSKYSEKNLSANEKRDNSFCYCIALFLPTWTGLAS